MLGSCSSKDDSPADPGSGAEVGKAAEGIGENLSDSLEQATTPSSPGSNEPESPGPGESPAARPFTTFATLTDATGDVGQGPAYADLVAITFQSNTTHLRLILRMAGEIPGKLPEDEVQGVGLDLFLTKGRESDYQFFADGGLEGWFGYLQTPKGFVDPGVFQVGGRHIVFTSSWKSLGDIPSADARAFSDWSKSAAIALLNPTSNDSAPDSGRRTISR